MKSDRTAEALRLHRKEQKNNQESAKTVAHLARTYSDDDIMAVDSLVTAVTGIWKGDIRGEDEELRVRVKEILVEYSKKFEGIFDGGFMRSFEFDPDAWFEGRTDETFDRMISVCNEVYRYVDRVCIDSRNAVDVLLMALAQVYCNGFYTGKEEELDFAADLVRIQEGAFVEDASDGTSEDAPENIPEDVSEEGCGICIADPESEHAEAAAGPEGDGFEEAVGEAVRMAYNEGYRDACEEMSMSLPGKGGKKGKKKKSRDEEHRCLRCPGEGCEFCGALVLPIYEEVDGTVFRRDPQ